MQFTRENHTYVIEKQGYGQYKISRSGYKVHTTNSWAVDWCTNDSDIRKMEQARREIVREWTDIYGISENSAE